MTVAQDVQWSGVGLHTGDPVTVRACPGTDGIAFRLGSERVAALADNVSETVRCTRLGPISTIEHLMSALAGLGITDAEIEVSSGEMPGLDGSSKPYVDAIRAAGTTDVGTLSVEGPFARVFEKGEYHAISIARGDGLFRYLFATGERWPQEQVIELELTPEAYADEIAPARTFALEEELPWIKEKGLAKGLDETSALVLGSDGYLNAARFADEPVRHKMLDLVGDLALSGVPMSLLSVVAERSGHASNVAAAAKLSQAVRITRE